MAKNWWKDLRVKITTKEPLKNKTTFKIGGSALFFCEPKSITDLSRVVCAARKNKISFRILGAGSNILVADKGFKGLVIQLGSPVFRKISLRGSLLEAGSGVALGKLVQKSAAGGLSGAEFLAGIPGTVGGALIMNAGAWGQEIAKIVEEVRVMDYNGTIKTLKKKNIVFSYRSSNLEKYILLGASFRLTRSNKASIRLAINRYLKERRARKEYAYPNAGCIFKNPEGKSAGRLLDACGLKGARVGGAYISENHANFIVNRNRASASDVRTLMERAKKKVRNKFKVTLRPEIKIWN